MPKEFQANLKPQTSNHQPKHHSPQFPTFASFILNPSELRYFLRLAYSGTPFHGWQIQPNALTVQEVLQREFSKILQRDTEIIGAGRTDTGVHAREMYAHFEAEKLQNLENLLFRLNNMVGKHIALREIIPVTEEAHARFDATLREYKYYITRSKDPFAPDLSMYFYGDLDTEAMNNAAQKLLHYEDFTSFSKSNTQTFTNLCKVTLAEWREVDDQLIFTIRANRFLRNMVRAIVGTLLEIGRGLKTVDDFEAIIQAKDRSQAGESAPARGLYLNKIEYPKEILNGGTGN